MIENDIINSEEENKFSKNDTNNKYKYNFNYYSPYYHNYTNNNDMNYNNIKQSNTSPKGYHTHSHFDKINNYNQRHHHHHIRENRRFEHTPQCRSNGSSPSPIKNISQPLFHTYYNSNLNYPNELLDNSNLMNINNKNMNSQFINSDELSNDFINNDKFNENKEMNPNKNSGINHLNAMAFDDYMSKVIYNKYNKMKQFNESYYLKKQLGDEENYINENNTLNRDNINDELFNMQKNLEKKYKLYNLITKYDNVGLQNNLEENPSKIEEDENINTKKNKKIKIQKSYKKDKIKKSHKKNISASDSDFDSSPEKNNFVKDENNKNKIQKAFNENIGIKNSSYISSTYNHVKEKEKDKINDNSIDQISNNSNLLEYLKKENDELKKQNNSYKETLDTLFYFLNNIFQKLDEEMPNNKNQELFDLSKDMNNIEHLSKKLINLESLINDNNYQKKIKNKLKLNTLLTITNENSIQLPEPTELERFNNLIEGINEKCFSFKNDNFIERYKNDNNIINNNIENNENIKQNSDININEDKLEDKKGNEQGFINTLNNGNEKCVACLLGCNVSKRGYSPMRYNPNNTKEVKKDDSSDLLDIYQKNKSKNEGNEKRKNNKISKSRDRVRDNSNKNKVLSSNNSRRNSKSMNPKKKYGNKIKN